MRKELYNMLCKELKEVGGGLIKHIDLWNHNVEFIEQEENWERPAVFVEFCPIRWNAIVDGDPCTRAAHVSVPAGQTPPTHLP